MYFPTKFRKLFTITLFSELILTSIFSCVVFNQDSLNNDEIVAFSDVDLDLSVHKHSCKESIIGNLVADAILSVAQKRAQETGRPIPYIALINAGAISNKNRALDKIAAGPLFKQDIEQLLPFLDGLIIVTLSGFDIRILLERSFNCIKPTGHNTHFLQLAGLLVQIDENAPAQLIANSQDKLIQKGQRVLKAELLIEGTLFPLKNESNYDVVTTTFLAQGLDGYISFLQMDEESNLVTDQHGAFLTKANIKADVLKNSQGEPLSPAYALFSFLSDLSRKGRLVPIPSLGRIKSGF